MSSNELSTLLITVALPLKSRAAPFHLWFPRVVGLQWPRVIILITVQKTASLSLLPYALYSNIFPIVPAAIISSALVGAIGGINVTSLRKIIAYSSINHIAWVIPVILIRETNWLLYFSFYCRMLTDLFSDLRIHTLTLTYSLSHTHYTTPHIHKMKR